MEAKGTSMRPSQKLPGTQETPGDLQERISFLAGKSGEPKDPGGPGAVWSNRPHKEHPQPTKP